MLLPLYGSLSPLGATWRRAVAAGSSLLNGLAHYWPLDELSGTRYDVIGDAHLTDNNTVGYSLRGPAGTVAQFVAANGEYLSAGKTSLTGDVTVTGWICRASLTGYSPIFTNTDAATRQVELFCPSGTDGLYACVHTNGVSRELSIAATVADGRWHYVVMTYSHTGDRKIRIYLDGNLIATSDATTGDLIDSESVTRIGGWGYGYTDGEIARVGVWSAVLADAGRSVMDAGNGKSYADLTAAEKVGLVSYWNMDETGGTRYDSHGTNHLTDNNTVGSVVNAGGAMHGAAASFVAGNGEYLSGDPATFPPSADDWTFSGWIKTPVGNKYGTLFYLGGSETFFEYYPHSYAQLMIWYGYTKTSGGTVKVEYNWMLPDGVTDVWGWNMVTFRWRASQLKLDLTWNTGTPYFSAAGTGVPLAHTDRFWIGASYGTSYSDGLIDEPGVWSRYIADAEVAEKWAAGAGKFYPFKG